MAERTARDVGKERLREYRRIVADVVGELRSQEIRDTYAALSLEELMDQHIARFEESQDPLNPSRLERLRKVRDDLVNNIEAMKETPPELFRRKDPDSDVNTPPEPEGT